jgi:hypothetical protein
MPRCSHSVTLPRFERRLPGGRHDLVFKAIFGPYPDGSAARYFGVSRMTIWRWRHDRSPLPVSVIKALRDLLRAKVAEAHQAQQDFRYFLAEPPSGQSCHPVQLDDGTFVFVKRRQANIRRVA